MYIAIVLVFIAMAFVVFGGELYEWYGWYWLAVVIFVTHLGWLFFTDGGSKHRTESAATIAAEERAEQALKEHRQAPHVIRVTADGCQVYKFEDDRRDHYFTRCADRVTTESSYSERQGKSTVQKQESITTETVK